MSPRIAPWWMALIAVAVSVAFAMVVRLPLPFDGFAVVVAAGLAMLLTFALTLFLPVNWVWTDDERLRHAFQARHGISDGRAQSALMAISTTHRRALVLRRAARAFTPDMQARTERAADLLEEAAREVFYDPDALSHHRANLIRADLVEDTVRAHADLLSRGASGSVETQIAASRESLTTALTSLEEAFAEVEHAIANRLLTKVKVASDTAETLLGRRRHRTLETTKGSLSS